MLASIPLVSALFAATPGVGVLPSPPDCERSPSALELLAEPDASAPVLCISPGLATNLLLDTPLPPGAVEVLYVHPAQAARQVEVRRQVRTVASYQREVQQWREQVRRCEEQSVEVRAAQGKSEGLRGLLSAGLMDKQGIASADLLHSSHIASWKKGAVKPLAMHSYRSNSRVAVELRLEFSAGEQPWVAEDVMMEDERGRELHLLPLWQETMTGADPAHVIVEAEAQEDARGPYSLKLWEAGGQRTVTVTQVVFP
jgi:uncharacterized protein (TIGR02268 family)